MRKVRNNRSRSRCPPSKMQWQRDATAAAIAGARGVIQVDGPIPPGTPVRAAQ